MSLLGLHDDPVFGGFSSYFTVLILSDEAQDKGLLETSPPARDGSSKLSVSKVHRISYGAH